MNTRTPLKEQHDATSGIGFQVHEDWLDECAGNDVVRLTLSGMAFTASAGNTQRVEVAIPRATAIALGILPASPDPLP